MSQVKDLEMSQSLQIKGETEKVFYIWAGDMLKRDMDPSAEMGDGKKGDYAVVRTMDRRAGEVRILSPDTEITIFVDCIECMRPVVLGSSKCLYCGQEMEET